MTKKYLLIYIYLKILIDSIVLSNSDEYKYISKKNTIFQSILYGNIKCVKKVKINVLNYKTGEVNKKKIKLKKNIKIDRDVYIKINKCCKDNNNKFNPTKIALINITKSKKKIFQGWIFSYNTSITVPQINEKLIYLEKCES